MPGYVLHAGATVLCAHGGQAQPGAVSPRVSVSGMPVVTMGPPYAVTGCPFATSQPQPCLTAQFTAGALRVTSQGAPLLLQSGPAVCAPNGTPATVTAVQSRVSAT